MRLLFCALLLASVPVTAIAAEPATKGAEAGKSDAAKSEAFDPAQLLEVFEKMFPAQPDPLPDRLALSRVTVRGLLPDGTYGRMMDGMMGNVVDRVLDLSESDLSRKATDGKPPSKETLRQQALKEDPHFEERMRIGQRVFGEEMAKIAAIVEPRLREGLARAMARRFDERQLTDINAFLATDSGRAFGGQSMAMWVDSDVLRSMVASFPEIITAMPAAMKRFETETAHLPKPKKEKKTEKEKAAASK